MRHGVSVLHRSSALLELSCKNASVIHQCRSYSSSDGSDGLNIAVLGGGITGLAAAYYINKWIPRAKVTLFEASGRIGGWLLSNRVPVSGGSILFEAGPRSLRTAKNGILAAQLIEELELKNDTVFTLTDTPAATHRYLYYPDHLVRMPNPAFDLLNNLKTLWTEPMFKGVLSGIALEAWKPPRSEDIKDESVGDFFKRRFGQPIVDNLLSGVLHGIYAGDAYQLSARSLFPGPWRDEMECASVLLGAAFSMSKGVSMTVREARFMEEMQHSIKDTELAATLARTSVFTFRDGIGMMVDRLARKLWASGSTEMKTSTRVSALRIPDDHHGIDVHVEGENGTRRFDHVISALSPAHLNSLIASPADHVPEIPSVTVMTVNLYFKQAEKLPPGPGTHELGFGYLIPRATPFEQNPERALGVVFDHAYAVPKISSDTNLKGTVTQDTLDQPGSKVTVMLGGHWWNDWPSYPDEQEGLKMARAILERHLGITQEPEAYQVNLQRDCIPQYTVGHEDRLKTAQTNLVRAYEGTLSVAGNWISGVGVNDCLRSAYEIVRRLETGIPFATGLEHIGSNNTMVRVRVLKRPNPKSS